MNWRDLLPENIAVAQSMFERRRLMILMGRHTTCREIAERFGGTTSNAHQMRKERVTYTHSFTPAFTVNRLKERAPVEHYMIDDRDVRRLGNAKRHGRIPLVVAALVKLTAATR